MKKTQLIDSVRNIRKRIVSYLSICLVIMLGVGAFLTSWYMEAGITNEAAGYYQDRNLKDFELISSLGVSEADLNTVRKVPGVTDAEGAMQFDGSLRKGDLKSSVTVLSVTERVSVPVPAGGRMPKGEAECAIGEDFSETSGIVPGDRVTLFLSGASDGDPLKGHEFTVTGLIKHPDYVHRKLTDTVVLPLCAFDMSVTHEAYTRAFVKTEDVSFRNTFTGAYFSETADTRKKLEALKEDLENNRESELQAEAYAEIDKEWSEALAKLRDGEDEIAASENRLDAELSKGRKKLNDAEKTLSAMLKKYNKELKDGEKSIEKAESDLKAARSVFEKDKAAYEQVSDLFVSKTSWVSEAIADVDILRSAPGSSERDATEQHLATLITDHKDDLQDLIDFAKTPEAKELVPLIEEATGRDDIALYLFLLSQTDAETILKPVEKVKAHEQHFDADDLDIMTKVFDMVMDVNDRMAAAGDDIADAGKKLSDAETLLDSKKKELKAGRRRLKEEKSDAERKIRKGWADYYSQRDRYGAKIEEAKALLLENREKAEAKLDEAREEVKKINCEYIVLDRNANAGYIDVKVQLESMRNTGIVFGVLFILITAIVCFSTLTIIIDEQKKLIGTAKAFGFHKREVLSKYLTFGVSAAVLGDILAVLTGLGLSEIVLRVYTASNLYQYGRAATVMRPLPTLLISLVMILVCAAASILACLDMLRSPASSLMKGQIAGKDDTRTRTTVRTGSRRSLYSRLTLRNMRDDRARVIVSTAIVAFCCMLIGIGLSFKLSTTGMLAKQEREINRFDLKVDAGDSVTDEELRSMEDLISENAKDYTSAVWEPHLFTAGNTITGMYVLAGDPSQLGNYFGMEYRGEPSPLSDEGVIIPVRMSENYGYEKGGSVPVFDSSMQLHDAPVTGTYTCYFERIAVTTPEGYRRIFGTDYAPRSFFVHLDGDTAALRKALLGISEDISFEEASDFRESFDSVGMLYNIIVFVTLGVAVFMSFMILTNLASIFVNRRKNELTVMRINGFSVKQTKGYLAKEATLTTLTGLAAGVIAGSLLSPFAVRILEPADLQFDRSYHILAWIAAAGIEGAFALIIYNSIFRRIKHLNFRDIE